MILYEYNIDTPVEYHLTGKFSAPSADWKHMDMALEDYQLIVVTEGELFIGDSNGRYKVTKGEHLILSPIKDNKRYGYQSSYCSFYWLHFMVPHEIKKHVNHIPSNDPSSKNNIYIPYNGRLPSLEKIVILMKQLQDSIRSGYDNAYINYMTTIILSELYHQYYPNPNIKTIQQVQIYNDIIDYVRLTLNASLKVSDISKQFGYNEKYLSHLFRSIKGIPLKQYILMELMELAKYYLTDTNHTINQIASILCYQDSHNFMKAFKKVVGLTPTEYRNAYSKRLLYHI